jgi:hypothetical protein
MANSPTVKDSMKLMSKSYRAVMNDKNIDSFKKIYPLLKCRYRRLSEPLFLGR